MGMKNVDTAHSVRTSCYELRSKNSSLPPGYQRPALHLSLAGRRP